MSTEQAKILEVPGDEALAVALDHKDDTQEFERALDLRVIAYLRERPHLAIEAEIASPWMEMGPGWWARVSFEDNQPVCSARETRFYPRIGGQVFEMPWTGSFRMGMPEEFGTRELAMEHVDRLARARGWALCPPMGTRRPNLQRDLRGGFARESAAAAVYGTENPALDPQWVCPYCDNEGRTDFVGGCRMCGRVRTFTPP